MQLSLEGMEGHEKRGAKKKKSWTYLEEAAQCARGSVLSVEERKSEAKRREAVGGLKAGGGRERGTVKVALDEIPLFPFTSKLSLAIEFKEAICISMGSS